jgi:hypothetical protein
MASPSEMAIRYIVNRQIGHAFKQRGPPSQNGVGLFSWEKSECPRSSKTKAATLLGVAALWELRT